MQSKEDKVEIEEIIPLWNSQDVHNSYLVFVNPPHYCWKNIDEVPTFVGCLVNTEILKNPQPDSIPQVRKMTPTEVSDARRGHNFSVDLNVIDTTQWRGIEGEKKLMWVWDTVSAGGGPEFINFFRGEDPRMTYVCTHEDLLSDPDFTVLFKKLENNEWNGLCLIINLEGSKVHHRIIASLLSELTNKWLQEASRLGIVYWPLIIVLAEKEPDVDLNSFTLLLNYIDPVTKSIKPTG